MTPEPKDENAKVQWARSYSLPCLFRDLEVGVYFWDGGNIWRKRSSRTCEIVSPERFKGRWFYCPMTLVVWVPDMQQGVWERIDEQ